MRKRVQKTKQKRHIKNKKVKEMRTWSRYRCIGLKIVFGVVAGFMNMTEASVRDILRSITGGTQPGYGYKLRSSAAAGSRLTTVRRRPTAAGRLFGDGYQLRAIVCAASCIIHPHFAHVTTRTRGKCSLCHRELAAFSKRDILLTSTNLLAPFQFTFSLHRGKNLGCFAV